MKTMPSLFVTLLLLFLVGCGETHTTQWEKSVNISCNKDSKESFIEKLPDICIRMLKEETGPDKRVILTRDTTVWDEKEDRVILTVTFHGAKPSVDEEKWTNAFKKAGAEKVEYLRWEPL